MRFITLLAVSVPLLFSACVTDNRYSQSPPEARTAQNGTSFVTTIKRNIWMTRNEGQTRAAPQRSTQPAPQRSVQPTTVAPRTSSTVQPTQSTTVVRTTSQPVTTSGSTVTYRSYSAGQGQPATTTRYRTVSPGTSTSRATTTTTIKNGSGSTASYNTVSATQ